jgi:hypothetical protein
MFLYLTSIDITLLFTSILFLGDGILWRRMVTLQLHRERRDVLVECALQGVLVDTLPLNDAHST